MKKLFVYLSMMIVLVASTSFTYEKATTRNSLGNGLYIGGTYEGKELKAHQSGWSQYTSTNKVKSGWLYYQSSSEDHAVLFFKVHLKDDGTGVVYLHGSANPTVNVWFSSDKGFNKSDNFCWKCNDAMERAEWRFDWK